MVISIIGCGWFGLHFAEFLIEEGHHVKGSTTSVHRLELLQKENIAAFLIDLSKADHEPIDPAFFHCDVLVITIPPKVRSDPDSKYLSAIQSLIEFIKKHQIRNVLYVSSTGVYGNSNSYVDETTAPEPESLPGRMLLQAESFFTCEDSFRTAIVRFGGLVGPGRDPANFFSGKKDIPNGQAPVNLIHLDDCCGICMAILKHDAFGRVINACSPEHPKKMDFYKHACIRAGVPVPGFRDELLGWKIVESVTVRKLLAYSFSRPINS